MYTHTYSDIIKEHITFKMDSIPIRGAFCGCAPCVHMRKSLEIGAAGGATILTHYIKLVPGLWALEQGILESRTLFPLEVNLQDPTPLR